MWIYKRKYLQGSDSHAAKQSRIDLLGVHIFSEIACIDIIDTPGGCLLQEGEFLSNLYGLQL